MTIFLCTSTARHGTVPVTGLMNIKMSAETAKLVSSWFKRKKEKLTKEAYSNPYVITGDDVDFLHPFTTAVLHARPLKKQ